MELRQLGIVLFVLSALSQAAADAPAAEKPAAEPNAAKGLALTIEESKKWEFFAGPDQQAKLAIRPDPVLRWSNPIQGEVYGNVFVWTLKGRPEVVAAVYKWFSPFTHMSVELHSLSLNPVLGKRDGLDSFHPARAGIELKPLPNAPEPGKTEAQRLRQMRTLCEDFTADLIDRNPPDQRYELRFMPTPVYRYQSTDPEVLDGALFAFVRATDPEIWLLLEARRKEKEDVYQWQYAAAQMNSLKMRLYHKGREVWTTPQVSPPWTNVSNPKLPYTAILYPQP